MPPAPTPKTLSAETINSNKQHFTIDVSFPIYCINFLNNKIVILGGGGGSSRTGVKNRLVCCVLLLSCLLWLFILFQSCW